MKNRNYEIHRYDVLNNIAGTGAAVIFGSDEEMMLPLNELESYYGTRETILNRSFAAMSVEEAADLYERCVAVLKPEKVLIRVGNDDAQLFASNREGFDRAYMELVNAVRRNNVKCVIAMLSVDDDEMSEHIRGLAASCSCEFCDVAAARLSDVKTVLDVYNTGFVCQLRKSLSVGLITRMLYSVMNEGCVEAEVNSKAEVRHGFMRFLRLANC